VFVLDDLDAIELVGPGSSRVSRARLGHYTFHKILAALLESVDFRIGPPLRRRYAPERKILRTPRLP
jgi:hypothetical protein